MIKAIIFDVDGVLIDLTIEKAKYQLERDCGITHEQTEPFFTNEFVACLKGESDLKEVIAPYLKKWGWNNSVNAFLDYWFESQRDINNQLLEEIQELKKKGYTVYVATNQEKYRAEYLVHKLGFGEIFDGFYASSSLGQIKKDSEFFKQLLKHIQLKPEETLFWDDMAHHVESAKSIGMNSELYTTYEDFKLYMRKNLHTSDSLKDNIKDEIEISSIADFVTTASHDLKNPLASIKAYAQIAKKRLQDTGDDKTVHYMNKIEEQTDRAAQLITEILDTGRISRGRMTIYKRQFRLDKLVSETVEDLQVTIHTHKIVEESRIKLRIEADKERIRRVLSNLLTNAVKYSPTADKVIVRTDSDNHNVLVSVQDFGMGIPITKQKNLFDPYFRVKEYGKNQAKGYGLGLPIVKRIVEAHDGKVWFESRKGKGSIFYFSLPSVNKNIISTNVYSSKEGKRRSD